MDLVRRVWTRRPDDPESGLGMVELIFAMVIFTIVALGVAYGLQVATQSTGSSRLRIQAASLASRELDYTRHEFALNAAGPDNLLNATGPNLHPLPGGTVGQPYVVDGVPFTVTRTAELLPAGAGTNPCDGGSSVVYPVIAVNVEVKWNGGKMGNVQPIESNTLLTPPKSWLNSGNNSTALSYAAVEIIDHTGTPEAGLPVTVSGGSYSDTETTTDDGCAVFTLPNTGSYTATVTQAGYVDSGFNTSGTRAISVAAPGSFTVPAPISYDKAGSLQETLSTDAGFGIPAGAMPLTLYNSGIQPSATKVITGSGTTTTITGLWPFSSGYISWPGACTQADPGSKRSAAVVVPAGGTGSVTQRLAPLTLNVTKGTTALANATVVAVPAVTTGCATFENPMTLGVTNSTGQLKTSLPAGTWTLQVTGQIAKTTWPSTGLLTPASAASTINVQAK
jgi:type II secretory pathway pseudopilin PulG